MIDRILYFLDFPNGFGGAARTLLKQAEIVKKYVSEVLITIPVDDLGVTTKEFEERCKQSDLKYAYQKYSVLFTAELIDIIGLSEDYLRIESYIKKYNPDIVHSTQINVCVEMACRKLQIPHIMNIYQCTEYIFPLKYPNVFPHYHICDSNFYLKKWKKRLQLNSVCIRNPCELIEHRKWELVEPVLICVGRVVKGKNQYELIKAVHRLILENMPVHLYLIGNIESEYGKECIEYINSNNISKWIKIYGYIPFAENEIAKSDALVCSSKSESFPNVIEIAMASKTVVISTPVAGVPEILKDGENAYVCTGFEAEDLYITIKKFYSQYGTQCQKQIIENAFQTYVNEFSIEAVADNLLSYYKYVYMDYAVKNVVNIKIEDIFTQYALYIDTFKKNESDLLNPKVIRNMIWLIPYIHECLKNKPYEELIIWGAGLYGAGAIEFAKLYFPELKIKCIVDKAKQGDFFGYPIMKYQDINWDNSLVWIAFVFGQMEAVKILFDFGLKYHEDFFFVAPVNI